MTPEILSFLIYKKSVKKSFKKSVKKKFKIENKTAIFFFFRNFFLSGKNSTDNFFLKFERSDKEKKLTSLSLKPLQNLN